MCICTLQWTIDKVVQVQSCANTKLYEAPAGICASGVCVHCFFCVCVAMYTTYVYTYMYVSVLHYFYKLYVCMGWLWLVGSFKL